LRKVVKELRKREFGAHLADARLIVSGKDVHVLDNQDLISLLSKPGQTHFAFTVLNLGATVMALRSEVERMKVA
jgi:hypothetical protein